MDPLLSLAFAVHSNRGAYAVLLGSGISRAAAIPTGWEVVIDLITKIAATRSEPCAPDPEAWFQSTFAEEPSYSVLLKKLARTQTERQQMLRAYFEPSPDEEAAGTKQPTRAHHALAALVKSGHVRVIITTNFDRLMERALEAVGVSPAVISTPGGVDGALPIAHSPCTVIKLHGDYLDVRVKNTPEELAKYDRRFNRLLDRIFDDFGMIICGWSADWDEALRDAFERCKSRRFTTYWASRRKPTDAAERLVRARSAQIITIGDADHFFEDILQKIQALATFDPPHPLSAKTAVATSKRLLADERHRIELHDLVMGEVERIREATSDVHFPVSAPLPVPAVRARLRQYESTTAILRDIVITACYWGTTAQHEVLIRAMERLANYPIAGGSTLLAGLRRYPALILLYAGGLAASVRRNYDMLRALLLGAKVRRDSGKTQFTTPADQLHPFRLLDRDTGNAVFEQQQRPYTPFNDYLFDLLREPLRTLIPDDEVYKEEFNRFECLFTLTAIANGSGWTPPGRYMWQRNFDDVTPVIVTELEKEASTGGPEWEPIKAGLLPSVQAMKEAVEKAIALARRFR